MSGYPGAAVLDSNSHQIRQVARGGGYFGVAPVRRITVKPGAAASAMIEGDAGRQPCSGSGLLVTPPNTTKSTKFMFDAASMEIADYLCNLGMHPVVAGTTGLLS